MLQTASVDPHHHDHLTHALEFPYNYMKGFIHRLKLIVSILRPRVRALSKWHIEEQALQVRVKHLVDVVQKLFQDVQPLTDSNPTDVAQGNEVWESSPTNLMNIYDDSMVGEASSGIYRLSNSKLRILSDNEVPFAPKDLTDDLIDELSFLRHNLMDLLLQNPITELKPLAISTQALIFRTGLFIYTSLHAEEEDDPKVMFCIFKLPDFLKAVDNLKQQARAPLNALKHQTETTYEGDLEKHFCSLLFYYGLDRAINFQRSLFEFDLVLQIEAFRHQTERLVNELKKSAEYAEEKLESIEERGEQLLQISKHIHDSLTVVDLRTQQLAEASKDVENHVNVVLNYSKAVHEQSMAIAGGVNGRYAAAGAPCSSSATNSVKQILEEQREMSNDQLNVTIVGMVQTQVAMSYENHFCFDLGILLVVYLFIYFGKEGLNLHMIIGIIIAVIRTVWYGSACSKPGGNERNCNSSRSSQQRSMVQHLLKLMRK
ncbi:hypothetical protein ACH5RR_034384 [Cinchona calisaya]|uniref:Uncharacterized protein n=1 Tax=Cinchona calisaya TaxID=153742 RepID=A0ABD2YG84_9GENT